MTEKQKSHWQELRLRLVARANSPEKIAALAEELRVTRPAVYQWLSGKTSPTAETTLRLLEWVTATERKQTKSPGSAVTPPERMTRRRNPLHEKPQSGQKKR